jgi:hypothetical protein
MKWNVGIYNNIQTKIGYDNQFALKLYQFTIIRRRALRHITVVADKCLNSIAQSAAIYTKVESQLLIQ